MTATNEDIQALDRISESFHENARNKGFVELHDRLAQLAAYVREQDPELADYILRCEAGNELMLMVTELGEAHEEIRTSPFAMNQTYYIDENGEKTLERFAEDGTMRKPEGLPSELADVQIRMGDTVGRRKISLGAIVAEKAEYNASRSQRHGGKKFCC